MVHIKADDDGGVIDLSGEADAPEFRIGRPVETSEREHSVLKGSGASSIRAVHNIEEIEKIATDKVKVKFEKFVNLIATHAYEDILGKHENEDVIISTDLLTDLANAHEEVGAEKKMPMIFIIGIILGVALTYVILKY